MTKNNVFANPKEGLTFRYNSPGFVPRVSKAKIFQPRTFEEDMERLDKKYERRRNKEEKVRQEEEAWQRKEEEMKQRHAASTEWNVYCTCTYSREGTVP